MLVTAAFTGATIGGFIGSLCQVYIGLILIYILISMALGFGLRPPYSSWFDTLMNFLRDVCEPFLGVFRKLIRPMGPVDLSPLFAILSLVIIEQVVVNVFSN